MKQVLFIISFISALTVVAQTPKGSIIVGGNFQVNSTSSDDQFNGRLSNSQETSSFSVNPQVGFYVSDNFIVGVGLGYETSENEQINRNPFGGQSFTSKFNGKFLFFNPFFNIQSKISEKFKFDLLTEFRFVSGDTEYEDTGLQDVSGDLKGFEFHIRPGFYYFLSKRTILVGRYGSLSYIKNEEEVDLRSRGIGDGEFEFKDVGFNLGFDSFQLGFMFLLPKK